MKKGISISAFIMLFLLISDYGYAVCVIANKANIRSGPGSSYEVVWQVYKYMPFLKVGVSNSGNWYAVKDVDGDVNWIHKSLVTSKYRCAVVKKEEVNIRRGPGTNYSRLGLAKKYYTFMVTERRGQWIGVKDDEGNHAWIHRDYLWIQ